MYSGVDSEFALPFAADLKNAGVPAWVDRLDASPETWQEDIQQALANAALFVAVLSPDFLETPYTRAEVELARERGVPLVSVVMRPLPANSNIPAALRHTQYDFTTWRDERLYRERLNRLISALGAISQLPIEPPDPEIRYLNNLIARLEARKGVLEYVQPAGTNGVSQPERLPPRISAIYGANSRVSFNSPAGSQSISGVATQMGAPLNSLRDAFDMTARFVIIGAPGIGKTAALERLALDDARAFLIAKQEGAAVSDSPVPLPLVISLGAWDERYSISDLIRAHWGLAGDPLALIAEGSVRLYLDGLNEIGRLAADRVNELRDWLTREGGPAEVIFTCRTREYGDAFSLDLPTVEIHEMDEGGVRRMAEATLKENQANALLEKLFPRARASAGEADAPVDPRELAQRLQTLARNPAYLSGLIFLFKSTPSIELPSSVGALYKRLMPALWVWKRVGQMTVTLAYPEMQTALAGLALTMIREDMPTSIPRERAAELMGGDQYLREARAAGILEVRGHLARFNSLLVQEYFAATAITRPDLPAMLYNARFDSRGERIATKWDQVLIMLAGLQPNPDYIVRDIAEVDPYLAGFAIASGVRVSDQVYDGTIGSLMSYAQDADPDEKVAAAKALNSIGRRASVPALLELMRSASWHARQSAWWALRDVHAPIPAELLLALADWDWKMNDAVAQALRKVGAEALPLLLNVLRDESWEKRRGAAWALGEIGDRAAVPGLVDALLDPESVVRCEAARALSGMQDSDAVEPLLRALRDEASAVQKAAADSLVAIKLPAVSGLREALHDPNEHVRMRAAEALGRIGDPSAIPDLLALTHDSLPNVRGAAIKALGMLRAEEALPRLVDCLEDNERGEWEDYRVCDYAVEALERIGTQEAQAALEMWRRRQPTARERREGMHVSAQTAAPPPSSNRQVSELLEGLRSADWERRAGAVVALSTYDHPVVEGALLERLEDDEPNVRHAVVHALRGRSSPAVIEGLLRALRDREHLVADEAAKVLSHAGPLAVRGLLTALEDADVNVRGRAIEALVGVGDPKAVKALIAMLSDTARPTGERETISELAAKALERFNTPEAIAAVRAFRSGQAPAAAPTLERTSLEIADVPVDESDTQRFETFDTAAQIEGQLSESFDPFAESQVEPPVEASDEFAFEDTLNAEPDFIEAEEPVDRWDDSVETEPTPVEPIIPPDDEPWDRVIEWADDVLDTMAEHVRDAVKSTAETVQDVLDDVLGFEDEEEETETLVPEDELAGPEGDLERLDEVYSDETEPRVTGLAWPELPELLDRIRGTDWRGDVREAAYAIREQARRLENRYDGEAVRLLVETLDERDTNVRQAAIDALGLLHAREAVPALLNQLASSVWSVRLAAVRALSVFPDPAVIAALIDRLQNDPQEHVREAAAEALGKFRSSEAVDALMTKALNDEDGFVRRIAAEALGSIRRREAVPALITALADSEFHVRWAAVQALGAIGDARAVPALIEKLKEEHHAANPAWEELEHRRISDIAAEALESIGTGEALEAVRRWRGHARA